MNISGNSTPNFRSSHAHPTYAEAIKEAALDATGKRPIHM